MLSRVALIRAAFCSLPLASVCSYLKSRGPTRIKVQTAVGTRGNGTFSYAEDGITPRPGQRWRIYGRHSRDGSIAAGICSGSRRVLAPHRRCPRERSQPLPADGVAGASLAALRQAGRVYRVKHARLTEAILASRDPDRGGYVGRNCGLNARARTVVVYLQFPALRSASLGQGVVLVSRFGRRYRIWARLH